MKKNLVFFLTVAALALQPGNGGFKGDNTFIQIYTDVWYIQNRRFCKVNVISVKQKVILVLSPYDIPCIAIIKPVKRRAKARDL